MSSIERMRELAGIKSPFEKVIKESREEVVTAVEEPQVITEGKDEELLEAIKHFSVILAEKRETMDPTLFKSLKESVQAVRKGKK